VDQVDDDGIPWLTDPQRDFLAHLTVLTLLPQMQRLEDIAEAGEISLRADDENVWVLIRGRSIVHAERDWLEWMTPRWHASESN
jgi:hypothetical protein